MKAMQATSIPFSQRFCRVRKSPSRYSAAQAPRQDSKQVLSTSAFVAIRKNSLYSLALTAEMKTSTSENPVSPLILTFDEETMCPLLVSSGDPVKQPSISQAYAKIRPRSWLDFRKCKMQEKILNRPSRSKWGAAHRRTAFKAECFRCARKESTLFPRA